MTKKITKNSRGATSARRAPRPTNTKAGGDGSGRKRAAAVAYQLRIVLRDVNPAVWRRVVVPEALTFESLHLVIQVTMGWQNYHLYDFEVGRRRFGIPYADFGDDDSEDVERVRLRDGGLVEGQTFLYRYDFGDGWEHDVVVERVLESPQEAPARARSLDGARACPPEDCGGPYGFAELLEALADADHPRHKELGEWLGEPFDPERFDAAAVDLSLGRVRV